MSKVEKYVKDIVKNQNNEEMEELEEVFFHSLRYIKDECPKMYDELTMDIYRIAYGECLTREDAIEYVAEMGEKWPIETTSQVARQFGITFDNFSEESFYWTMNMMYSDYHDILGNDTGIYVKMSKAFLMDEDAPEGNAKVFRYVRAMK